MKQNRESVKINVRDPEGDTGNLDYFKSPDSVLTFQSTLRQI